MPQTFEQFFERRQKAASAYVAGDGAPVDAIVPHSGEASFHSPTGDTITGAAAVAKRYRSDAQSFQPGGGSRLEVLHKFADQQLAFWTGYQMATVRIKDAPQPIEMRIRVTEVFRNIDGEWRLIHRHADRGQAR